MATHAVKNFIRSREFFKIVSALETGAEHGMWSFQRYTKWLEGRTNFFVPGKSAEPPDSEPSDDSPANPALPPLLAAPKTERRPAAPNPPRASGAGEVHRIEIEPDETGFGKILKQPQ
jgi:hypothetical protein